MLQDIRNFVIIAHVDHGKSTLADRLLEVTGAVEMRRMRSQYLDQLDLERERGITIKMAPVRMEYVSPKTGKEYVLNLIDTPGHSDFAYEVSRALHAVEGAVLLVDATKGIQAQTLSNLRQAEKSGLAVVGAVNKVDVAGAPVEKVVESLAKLLKVSPDKISRISGKTGDGVPELLERIVLEVPPPRTFEPVFRQGGRALIFDSLYNDHKGILAHVRVVDGEFKPGDEIGFLAPGVKFKIKEVGHFLPQPTTTSILRTGEIGYIATGIKEPEQIKIGDTVLGIDPATKPSLLSLKHFALAGYREPGPVVFISFYPDETTKFEDLKKGLERLRLTDSALLIEPDSNEALGRGMKVGFLGQLHFEIISTRLERENGLHFLTSFPSIAYRVKERHKDVRIVRDAHEFPEDTEAVWQPMINVEILSPNQYLSTIVNLQHSFDLEIQEIENLDDQVLLRGIMPLAELIRDFDDQLKSLSQGYASFSYELGNESPADVEKLEVLIAGEVAAPLTRIVYRRDIEREARATVERLKKHLPQQQFVQAIQARSRGRIIARETIAAMKKDVTGYLYGGDRSRKMKLWKKQKKGKEKLLSMAKVNLSAEVFREILKK